MNKRRRRCKILATLGPASNDEASIEKLWRAGADVFRINMSHANPDAMRETTAMIRAVEERVGRPIGVLVDLQGPKLRVGVFAGGGAISSTARPSPSIPTRRRAMPRASACRIRKSCRPWPRATNC